MDEDTRFSQARRDDGIARALAHAEREHPDWADDADRAVERYCQAHPDTDFLGEDVRVWCVDMGLIDAAPDGRAWGAVMKRAAALGVVRKVGYAPAKSSNLSPKILWSTP